jgi:low temperature requirement protein LtrA
MAWRIWSDLSVLVGWVETDDLMQRLTVLFIMSCLLGLTTNMLQAFHDTYSQLVAFYLAARLLVAFYYCVLAGLIPMVRGMMITQSLAIVVPSKYLFVVSKLPVCRSSTERAVLLQAIFAECAVLLRA